MKIVTAGSRYVDIDAYACMVAMSELYNLLGESAVPASTVVLNESITPTILSWGNPIKTSYQPAVDDVFVVVDISDPKFLDQIISLGRVVELIDHHSGHEKFWKDRLNGRDHIELVGAASTLVFEQWQTSGHLSKISELSARLLVTGILDNTLNFGAHSTTDRDQRAYNALSSAANLPENWAERYFQECQELIEADLSAAIAHDAQSNFENLPKLAAQLLVWDASTLLTTRKSELPRILDDMSEDWFLNLISLQEGKSYIVANKPSNQKYLGELLGISFSDGVARADRLWLRKEIVKLAQP